MCSVDDRARGSYARGAPGAVGGYHTDGAPRAISGRLAQLQALFPDHWHNHLRLDAGPDDDEPGRPSGLRWAEHHLPQPHSRELRASV